MASSSATSSESDIAAGGAGWRVHCIRVSVLAAASVTSVQCCFRKEADDHKTADIVDGALASLASSAASHAAAGKVIVHTLELLPHQYVVCARWMVDPEQREVRAIRFGTNCGQWSQWYGDAQAFKNTSLRLEEQECAAGAMLSDVHTCTERSLHWKSAPAVCMRALMKTAPVAGFEVSTTSPIPRVGAGEVLIRVEMASLCGSDILLYRWHPAHMAEKIAKPPFIPGHEGCGIVVGRGQGVTLPLGVRVIPDSHVPCNLSTCYHCTHDSRHLCPKMVLLGHHIDGVFAQYVVAPAHACYPLRTTLPARLACVLEPFGVAYRTVEMIGPVAGETVLISGCGPIGLFAAAVCKKRGAFKVIACDISEYRLEIARQVGADLCVNTEQMSVEELTALLLSESQEVGPGCIIEASGAPVMVNNAFTWIRKCGRMCFVGLPKAPLHIEDPLNSFVFKEVTVKTVHGRHHWRTFERVESLLASGSLPEVEHILTDVFPLWGIDEAFTKVLDGKACKVQLQVVDETVMD